MCPYGADCYRRNKVHRRSYKHPGNAKPCPKRKNSRTDSCLSYNFIFLHRNKKLK